MGTPPLSRTAYVVARVKQDLADGKLRPGQPLRQVEIAQRYGVSPTPVREALRILAADGTIQYSPHRGATVNDVDPVSAHDLYRLRALMEGLATELAVGRLTPAVLESITDADSALRAAVEAGVRGEQLSELNKKLHFAIFEQGSSQVMVHIRMVWERFPSRVTLWGNDDNVRALIADHDEIIAAIRAGEAEHAGALMTAHVLHAGELRTRNR